MYGAAWTRSGAFSLMANGGQLSEAMPVPMSMHNGDTPGARPMIVGLFTDMDSNRQLGYVLRDGMLEKYAATSIGAFATVAFGINPDGVVVGQFALTNGGLPHGFIAVPPRK